MAPWACSLSRHAPRTSEDVVKQPAPALLRTFVPSRDDVPSKAEFTKSRRSAEKLYREGHYSDAVEGLRRTKGSCWSALEATDRGWLVSNLGLAALRAGQPEPDSRSCAGRCSTRHPRSSTRRAARRTSSQWPQKDGPAPAALP